MIGHDFDEPRYSDTPETKPATVLLHTLAQLYELKYAQYCSKLDVNPHCICSQQRLQPFTQLQLYRVSDDMRCSDQQEYCQCHPQSGLTQQDSALPLSMW